jgi:hypothetical protein
MAVLIFMPASFWLYLKLYTCREAICDIESANNLANQKEANKSLLGKCQLINYLELVN